jgi:hypothetical protein
MARYLGDPADMEKAVPLLDEALVTSREPGMCSGRR